MALRREDRVRVIKAPEQDRPFAGTLGFLRPPKLGDTGKVVFEYKPDDPEGPLAVECVDDEGNVLWLVDFEPSELAPVSGPD